MDKQWIKDLTKAQIGIELIRHKIFQNKIELISTENQEILICKWLDQYSGIDLIGKKNDNLMTIACRIQWDKNYKTFTIRYKRISGIKTEYEKRIEAIEKGYLYPGWMMHVYMSGLFNNDNRLLDEKSLKILGCAVIRTDELYKFITEEKIIFHNKANYEGNEFIYIYWDHIKHLNSFWIYKKKEPNYFAPKQIELKFNL